MQVVGAVVWRGVVCKREEFGPGRGGVVVPEDAAEAEGHDVGRDLLL